MTNNSNNYDLNVLYEAVKKLSDMPDCKTCRLCEENVGLVYLLPQEEKIIKNLGIKIQKSTDKVNFIFRNKDGWCDAYDYKNNKCTIYNNRPLCCRIYPLDLIIIKKEIWWIVFKE